MDRELELLYLIEEQAKDSRHGAFQPPEDHVVFSLDRIYWRGSKGGVQTTFLDMLVEEDNEVHISR